MKVLLVHGEKPQRNKALHPAFEERLKLAIKLDQKNHYDLIVLSGGQTRKQFPPESAIGYEYLKEKVNAKIIQENQSRTTIENIKFSKNALKQYSINQLAIITGKSRLFRHKYLWKKLWPGIYFHCTFYGAEDYFFFYPLLELSYFLYAILDIHEIFLPKFTKKIFRNS